MAAKPQEKAPVVCPRCGHQQLEPPQAISSNCRNCGEYLRVQELLKPVRKAEAKAPDQRRVSCFDCGTEQDVPAAAQSAMCKRCSSYIDLKDYTIANAVSKNFKTKGRFVVEKKGYVFNTDVIAREIVVRGQVIGKLAAEETLTIYSTAEIKGKFRSRLLIIPAENAFHSGAGVEVDSVDIQGEWVGALKASGTVRVRAAARLFGDVEAQHLVVEEGGVIVGNMRIRQAVAPVESAAAEQPAGVEGGVTAAPVIEPATTPVAPRAPRPRTPAKRPRPKARGSALPPEQDSSRV